MNKPTAPLRIGAIGCGNLASGVHLPGIAAVPELKLVALCDLNEEALRKQAEKYRISATFTDYRKMLDTCELDGVCIVGPPALHVLVAPECLRRQIPFMTEKPLSTSVAESRKVAALAVELGDCGMVGYTNRCAPAQRLAKRITLQPEFGKLSYVATTHLTAWPMWKEWGIDNHAESLVLMHGVHAIDLWRFFGGNPTEVAATVANFKMLDERNATGSVLVSVRQTDGAHGTIHIKAGASHNGDINTDVMGERSRVRVENSQQLYYERESDWIKQVMQDDPLTDALSNDYAVGQFLTNGMVTPSYVPDFFRFEWQAFARNVLAGKPLSPSIVDAYHTDCLTDAIRQSLQQNGALTPVKYDL